MTRTKAISMLFTFTLLSQSADASPVNVPPVLGHWNGRAIWVAADRALDESGKLKSEVLGESVTRELTRRGERNSSEVAHARRVAMTVTAAAKVDDCQRYTTWTSNHFKSTSSLNALVEGAVAIVTGTVVAKSEGFLYDTPGMLLSIDGRYLKGEPSVTTYVFYPYGRIRTAHGMLCSRPLGPYAVPALGDRVVVFAMMDAHLDGAQAIFAVETHREMVHEQNDGKLYLPEGLRSAPARSFDTLIDDIGELVAASSR